jgi:sec-independent protein translocase protein TatA
MEIVLVAAIALLVLGPKRLPGAAKSLGKGIREFKDSVSEAMPTHDEITSIVDPNPVDDPSRKS